MSIAADSSLCFLQTTKRFIIIILLVAKKSATFVAELN
jgi:hypothetical protein